jgi:hypothetical protein
MWWRIPHGQFEQQKGAPNRDAFKALVEADHVPDLLAYTDGSTSTGVP